MIVPPKKNVFGQPKKQFFDLPQRMACAQWLIAWSDIKPHPHLTGVLVSFQSYLNDNIPIGDAVKACEVAISGIQDAGIRDDAEVMLESMLEDCGI